MSHTENYLSGEESDDAPPEVKRSRHESRNITANRKSFEKKPLRKSRLPSKDSAVDPNFEALIFDSGAHSIKINYSFEDEAKVIPNCIMKAKSERKRLFIGNQIDECRDCSGLFYLIPTERGYITKWDVQKPIWDYVFSKNVCPINNYPILMTQPLFNFKSIQDCIDEIFFEEYEVSSLLRLNPTDLAAVKYQNEEAGNDTPCIIVDSGYSFTHVVPYLEGKKYLEGAKRINVGGKLLTNHLKDIISYRQYHVMEETFVINQVKEDTCFVSQDFKSDLQMAISGRKNHIVRNYVLPDFNNIRRGYIQDPNRKDELAENCQILRLNNERFTVPEILFHPSDIAIKSIGIAEAVFKSIMSCPQFYRRKLAKNIVCVGGTTKFPGFKTRLFNEVRSMIPASWEVNVYHPPDPIQYSWSGGKAFLQSPGVKSKFVTKEQYEELGLSAIQERFNDFSPGALREDPKPKAEVVAEPISYIEHIKKYDIFGKGELTETRTTPNPEDVNPAQKNENEEIDVINKNEQDESTENKQNEGVKNSKLAKKTVRNSGGLVYSLKIVPTAVKPPT